MPGRIKTNLGSQIKGKRYGVHPGIRVNYNKAMDNLNNLYKVFNVSPIIINKV